MTECEMYVKFRTEIETMYAPHIINECQTVRISNDEKEIGILMVKDGYIIGLYILPEHRRKGYGRKAVIDYIKKYGMLKDLTILNSNLTAKAFWESIFELEPIKINSIDTYFGIKALKGGRTGMTCKEAIKDIVENGIELGAGDFIDVEALKIAVSALEKQIPKKPIKYDKYYYKCPVCDIDIGVNEEDLTIYEETPPYYCQNCGQALDWSDD